MNVIRRKQKGSKQHNRQVKQQRTKLLLHSGVTRRKLEKTLSRINQIDISMRKANLQCEVPTTNQHPKHSREMNNCHIIGKRWLEKTRYKKTTLLSWRTSPRQLAEIIADVVTRIDNTPLELGPMLLPRLDRFPPRPTPDKECKYTVACRAHDGVAYLKVDDPNADLNDPEVHFQLGFRAISSYAAWAEGCKLYSEGYLNKALLNNKVLSQIPGLRSVTLDGYYRACHKTVEEQALTNELNQWQNFYITSDYRAIATARSTTEARIAMTGCGFWGQSFGKHIVGTVLTGYTDNLTDTTPTEIILSCRKSQLFLYKLLQPLHLRLKALLLARKIKSNKGIKAIVDFASVWEFFYVADKDYRTHLKANETEYIEEKVAQTKLKSLMAPPIHKTVA